MSDMEIGKVLDQMRAISSELRPPQTAETGTLDFSNVMQNAFETVNDRTTEAKQLQSALESGSTDASVAEVMIAMQKASLSFQAMVEVRNRLVDAYKEVMNMPI